ncbi:MAG: imelysin family protein [Pseudomonadota bacterium]
MPPNLNVLAAPLLSVALIVAAALTALPARADAVLDRAVETHVLPGYERLKTATEALAAACGESCAPTDEAVRAAYHDAFDAWIGVDHLRFGPAEEDERAFSLAFWPDTRGATPKTLSRMLRAADDALLEPETFAKQSVAARGFFAMERLLYDDALPGEPAYRDRLIGAVAADIAATAATLEQAWREGYATTVTSAGGAGNDRYLTVGEAQRDLFTALSTGLQTTAELRLGRPLGTFDRPRPNRAEARRSGRSLRNVVLSLEALQELAAIIAALAPDEVSAEVGSVFDAAIADAKDLDDPVFAGVATPATRLPVEALQVRVNGVRQVVSVDLGGALGIAAGFNSLDGD